MPVLPLRNLKPSVCIDAVLADHSLAEAMSLVKQLGFNAFEFWAWWEKDLDQLDQLLSELELTVASCCTRFIPLTDPQFRNDYAQGVVDSIEAAKRIQCRTLISQVGDALPNVSRQLQQQSIIDGLRQVAPQLESEGITLVIEPLNIKVDHPGYFLVHSKEAFHIIDQVDSPNVKVVFDIYHQQISEGNLLANLLPNLSRIGHLHAAGNPGRNELTRGEINYPEIFRAVDAANYQGHVGLEYWPVEDPKTGLAEIAGWFGN